MKLFISPCPNDTFMFHAFLHGLVGGPRVEAAYHDIEALNARALAGEAEVSKVSAALLPAIADRYEVLDSGAALGRGNGPVLVARRGRAPGDIRTVAVPGPHTTANRLLELFYPGVGRVPMLFSDIAGAVERGEVDAGVLIHEGRFVFAERGLELVADLGAVWERERGLPLPLGVIAVRRDVPAGEKKELERALRRSIEYGFAHPEASRAYIKEHARELDDRVIDAHIRLFVNEHSLSLQGEGRRALEAFAAQKNLQRENL